MTQCDGPEKRIRLTFDQLTFCTNKFRLIKEWTLFSDLENKINSLTIHKHMM